ncbi:MAG TPA: menaquinol-cytochrome c reductase cytochrome b subunit [Actinomycetota bacterium]|nr:menaquinol-cytochrome c reductase cytochrome b subunit [Actinomycetota bacterium]
MARDDTSLDQETFDRVLAEEVAKGADRRVAEGRARAAALRAARAKSGEGPAATPATAPAAGDGGAPQPAAAPAAAAPAAAAPSTAAPAGGAAPAAVGVAAPAAAVAATLTAPERQAPAPTGNVPEPKRGAPEKHRLLALVPPEGIQRVEREQGDRINVWPHLLIEEFVAMMLVLGALTIFSTFVNAPLRELANPNLTPNPSKAPWYFLGLQELLRYFHPMVAGVLFAPTLVLLALAVAPFVDRNPSTKPGDRKIAITLFTMLLMFGAVLTIIGSFFRGTGYNWVWPWAQGVFFEL